MPDSNRIDRIYVGIDVTWNENIPIGDSNYFQPLEAILNVLTPLKSKQLTDFEYLIGLCHIDNNIQYEVTRLGKSQGFIVAWRKPVFSARHYGREEEAPIHVRDIEALMATHYDHLANFDLQPELPTYHHLIQIRVYERVNASSNRNSITPPASY